MITEDKIAAATLAQIFGSELTSIDESITHKTSKTANATKINPKEILLGKQTQDQHIANVQLEAESAFPYQPSSSPPPQSFPQQMISSVHSNQHSTPVISNEYLERICIALEKISSSLEKSELLIKKPIRSRSETK
jgi:hypothetical protein